MESVERKDRLGIPVPPLITEELQARAYETARAIVLCQSFSGSRQSMEYRLWIHATLGPKYAEYKPELAQLAFITNEGGGSPLTIDQQNEYWIPYFNKVLATLREAKPPAVRFSQGDPVVRWIGQPNGLGALASASREDVFATVGYRDNTIKIWQWSTRQLLQEIESSDTPWSLAMSPDGRYVASGDLSCGLNLWEARTGAHVARFTGHKGAAFALAFGPENHLFSGCTSGDLHQWDPATGTGQRIGQTGGNIHTIAWSPDHQFLAIAAGHTFLVIRAGDYQVLHQRGLNDEPFVALAFSPNGQYLATGSDDSSVRIWRTADGRLLRHYFVGEGIASVLFSPDGQSVLIARKHKDIEVRRISDLQMVHRLVGHPFRARALAVAPDGSEVLSGSEDGTLICWNPNLFNRDTPAPEEPVDQERRRLKIDHVRALESHKGDVSAVAWSPTGQLFATGSWDDTIILWRPGGPSEVKRIKMHGLFSFTSQEQARVSCLTFSPDGVLLAAASADSTIAIYRVADGQELARLRGHRDHVVTIAFSPDGSLLASGAYDGSLRLWRTSGWTPQSDIQLSEEQGRPVRAIAFSPEGDQLSVGGEFSDRVHVISAANGEAVCRTNWTAKVNALVYLDRQTILAGCEDGSVKYVNVPSGEVTYSLEAGGAVHSLALSPDGKWVAAGAGSQGITMWKTSGDQTPYFMGWHKELVRSVAFSPDSGSLISGSRDTTARLWRIQFTDPPGFQM